MLTELQVKSAKPREKSYMIRDDRGLNFRVDPSGRKYFSLTIRKSPPTILGSC